MDLSRRQLTVLVLLTLVWGLNWPIMKVGVTDYPPLTFRAISMWLGLPVLGLAMLYLKVHFFSYRATVTGNCSGWRPPTCSSGMR